VALLLATLLLAGGCAGSGDGYEYVDDSGASAPASVAASQPPITARELVGHWVSSDSGDAYIQVNSVQVNGAELSVVYGHDGGRMIGSLRGATFVGWWSETPTRRPTDDAGGVQFTFVRNGGTLTASGWWRPGTDSAYETDWTMRKADAVIPAAVRAQFADRSQFVRHP
jgi:hypothetical protein